MIAGIWAAIEAVMQTYGFELTKPGDETLSGRNYWIESGGDISDTARRGGGIGGGTIALQRAMNVTVYYRDNPNPRHELDVMTELETIVSALHGLQGKCFYTRTTVRTGPESHLYTIELDIRDYI